MALGFLAGLAGPALAYGMSRLGRSSDRPSNPYAVGGVQPMNVGGFRQAPAGFQFGGSAMRPTALGNFNIGTFGNVAGNMAFNPTKPGSAVGRDDIEDFTERMYGDRGKKTKSAADRIRQLLSGESGSAIGGIAQGAGAAIGGYLSRRGQREMTQLEREKFNEELRQEALREEQRKALREFLMPTLQQMRPR